MLLAAGAGALGVGCGRASELPTIVNVGEAGAPAAASASASAVASAQPSQAGKGWPVGVFLPLTGGDAQFGIESLRGIELAVDQINAAGGVRSAPLALVVLDDKSSPSEATRAVQHLTDQQSVVALLGEVASVRSRVGGIVATQRRVPMITPSSTNPAVTKVGEYVFRTCFLDAMQGAAAAELILKVLGKKKVGLVVAENDIYSMGLAEELKKGLRAASVGLVLEKRVVDGEREFGPVVKQLIAKGAEIVYAPLYFPQMIALARAAKAEGLGGDRFVGGDGWADPSLFNELEGGYFTDHWAEGVPTPVSRRFAAAYVAKHHRPATSLVASGYDAVLVLADAMRQAKAVEPRSIRDALATTKNVEGATGSISIDAERNATKPMIIAQIRNKTPRFATAVGPGADAILAATKQAP